MEAGKTQTLSRPKESVWKSYDLFRYDSSFTNSNVDNAASLIVVLFFLFYKEIFRAK